MASVELTNKSIRGLKLREQRYIMRDAKVSGLELRVAADGTESGTARST